MVIVLVILLLLYPTWGAFALNTVEQEWVDAVTDIYGKKAGKRVIAWRNTLSSRHTLDRMSKLEKVNGFFNQLYFVDDITLWGKTIIGLLHWSFSEAMRAIVRTLL